MSKIVFWEPCAQKQKPQEATWKKQIPCAQKTFSKDLKTQLLGEQHATTSLGNKKHETDWTCF